MSSSKQKYSFEQGDIVEYEHGGEKNQFQIHSKKGGQKGYPQYRLLGLDGVPFSISPTEKKLTLISKSKKREELLAKAEDDELKEFEKFEKTEEIELVEVNVDEINREIAEKEENERIEREKEENERLEREKEERMKRKEELENAEIEIKKQIDELIEKLADIRLELKEIKKEEQDQ